MNFYKHHLGDYEADTAHLSWDEDAAYRRLLSLYYRREKPIPASITEACRLVRAKKKNEQEAVKAVLDEFFICCEDGWRNKRCDQEIAAANGSTEQNSEKKSNVQARQQKHRDERKALFDAAREGGHNPKWNTSTEELRAMVRRIPQDLSRTCDAPVTQPDASQAGTGNAPDTAIHKPDTRLQIPIQEINPPPPSGEPPPKKNRPSRICPDEFWVNPGMEAWAKEHCPSVDIALETAKFRDHNFAKPIRSWTAAWRNWMRKAVEIKAANGAPKSRDVQLETAGFLTGSASTTSDKIEAGDGIAIKFTPFTITV